MDKGEAGPVGERRVRAALAMRGAGVQRDEEWKGGSTSWGSRGSKSRRRGRRGTESSVIEVVPVVIDR